MSLRNSRQVIWQPRGLTDADDGGAAFPGAMTLLQNLIPDPKIKNRFVPRPAASTLTSFGSFTTPAQGECLFSQGAIAYGFIASARFANKSEPFAFNLLTSTFLTISGVTSANCPTTASATGDWTPPSMQQVGQKIVATHPGFPGGATKFGWMDISGFSSNSITGSTHTSTTVDTLSSNVLLAGWTVGMTFTDSSADIPPNTTIVAIASNGLSVTLSAAATGSHAGTTCTVQGGSATTPLWAAGDTNGNNLSATPKAVGQFNGRAYYAVANGVVFSDSLNAVQVTNATQALSFGNGIAVTALGGLPLYSSTVGGMIQSLIAFQGDSNMVQISGDTATSNLAQNNLGVGVGTLAPLTICSTTKGLAFVSPDGVRLIDFTAQVSDPIGAYGDGVAVPFQNAVNPTRMCAAFNDNVLRVTVENGNDPNNAVQEYWLDFTQNVWTGPHTFPASMIQPNQNGAGGFIMFANGINAKLWQSAVISTVNSTYTENAVALQVGYETALLPDNEQLAMNSMVEATLGVKLPLNETLNVVAMDESGNLLDQLVLTNPGAAGAMWDVSSWDASSFVGGSGNYVQHPLYWHTNLVFKQMSIQINGAAAAGLSIGALRLRYQELGYLTQLAS